MQVDKDLVFQPYYSGLGSKEDTLTPSGRHNSDGRGIKGSSTYSLRSIHTWRQHGHVLTSGRHAFGGTAMTYSLLQFDTVLTAERSCTHSFRSTCIWWHSNDICTPSGQHIFGSRAIMRSLFQVDTYLAAEHCQFTLCRYHHVAMLQPWRHRLIHTQ